MGFNLRYEVVLQQQSPTLFVPETSFMHELHEIHFAAVCNLNAAITLYMRKIQQFYTVISTQHNADLVGALGLLLELRISVNHLSYNYPITAVPQCPLLFCQFFLSWRSPTGGHLLLF